MIRLLLAALVIAAPAAAQTARPVVRSQADLPRHTYAVGPRASDLMTDRAAFDALAAQLRTDTEATLRDYDIADRSTRAGLYTALQVLAFERGDVDAALVYADTVQALQDKPSARLVSGLWFRSVVAAERAGGSLDARRAAFRAHFAAAVAALPWAVVADDLEQARGTALVGSAAFYRGLVQSDYDAGTAATGEIGGAVARDILWLRFVAEHRVPVAPDIAAVVGAAVAANRVDKPDVWAARDLDLTGATGLTPVVAAIWDSGIDATLFPGRMWTNASETPDGRDDDGNGFVDDVHGVAFDREARPSTGLLVPLSPEDAARMPDLQALVRGQIDTRAAVDSPEALAYQARMRALAPAETGPFLDALGLAGEVNHGTHVAGIAAAGNPAVRLLAARNTLDHRAVPEPPTLERERRTAASFAETVAYFQAAGVRVVNMSWGGTPAKWEHDLEVNGIGADAAERQRLAAEMFAVWAGGLRAAIASAPEILFVAGAGNANSDAAFAEFIPSGIDAPNVLTVAAVDQAGDEAGFTSFGPTVDVHANGFEVESVVPGGTLARMSGTSMSAPQVTNLAAKLFALDPTLTAAEAAMLIRETAEWTADGRRRLIHPQRAAERVRARLTDR